MFESLINYIRTLYKSNEFIPLHVPCFAGNEKKYLNECIDTNFVSSVGNFVTEFEQRIVEYTGAKYAVATVNGTAALHTALNLLDVNSDHEVITQALTFVATGNAIAYTGAKPIFIDVEKETLGLSPQALESFLKEHTTQNSGKCINKKSQKWIKACMPMHTFGHPCKIDKIKEICDKYNIGLIEDSAESLGSFYQNIHTGNFGEMGVLSFNGNKTITTGGGGMIITNNEDIAKRAKHLTTTAKMPHKWEYYHDEIGFNYRLTNIAAALGCAQMEQLNDILEFKRNLANKYQKFCVEHSIPFFSEPSDSRSNYWLNAIVLKDKNERDGFLDFSNNNGVMTRPIWNLLNSLPSFQHNQSDELKNSKWLWERIVNIPSSVIL